MKILVVTNLFHPDRGGGASVFSDLCAGLSERGWKVTVLCTYPYYPEWKQTPFWGNAVLKEEKFGNVSVWRHWIYVPSGSPGLLQRLACELTFGLSLLRSLFRGGRQDVVLAFCPMLSGVLFASIRRVLLRELLWINVQDLPADAAAASGISRSRLVNSVAQWAQKFLFNQARCLSTISPVMLRRIASLSLPRQQLFHCPNWLNGTLAKCIETLPSKLGRVPGRPVRLLYAGNIGKKQGLLEFCEVLGRSSGAFQFKIHGSGGEAGKIEEWVRQAHDARFVFGEFLDEAGFAKALNETDWFVITEKSGSGASFIPSKLIPGIASGTPILAVCDKSGPLGFEVGEFKLGLLQEWGELGDLPSVLTAICDAPGIFVEFQRNCLQHARIYTSDYAIDRWDGLLRAQSGAGGSPIKG